LKIRVKHTSYSSKAGCIISYEPVHIVDFLLFYLYNRGEMPGEIFCKLKLIFIPCQDNKYRPKFLGSKFLFHYAVVLLLLKLAIIPFLLYFPRTVFFADLTKTNLIELANTTREYFGFQPLKENTALDEAAYLKAKDMIEKGYFAHNSPEGITPWSWLKKSGYNYRSAGENLAIGFLESEQVHQAWMDSLLHKKNILNPNYQEIGIAVLRDNFQGNTTTLVVQFFGTQKTAVLEEKALPLEVPTKEETPEIPVIMGEEEEKEQIVEEKEILVKVPAPEGEEDKSSSSSFAVAPERKEVLSAATGEAFEKTPAFIFFQFMTSDYYDLIQKIIYGSLIFIILCLFVTVFCDIFIYHKFEIQYKDIVFKTIGFSALWFILLFLDKLIIIQIIAHNFRIE